MHRLGTRLQELPAVLASFAEPERIRRLDCSNNAIAALPPWLARFAMLQTLSVAHNALTCLSDSITQLHNLKARAAQACSCHTKA